MTPVFALTPSVGEVRPMMAGAVSRCTGAKVGCCELVQRRQLPPDEAKNEINRQIGEARFSEFRNRAASQDQTRHVRHRPYAKQKRAPETSATQRPRRPLVSELGPGGPSPEKLKSGELKSGKLPEELNPPRLPHRPRRRARGSRLESARRSGRSSGGSRLRSSRSCRDWL